MGGRSRGIWKREGVCRSKSTEVTKLVGESGKVTRGTVCREEGERSEKSSLNTKGLRGELF